MLMLLNQESKHTLLLLLFILTFLDIPVTAAWS